MIATPANSLFGVSWVMPRRVVDLLSCWNGRWGLFEAGNIWRMIAHYIMWCLWCERNARTFNEEETSIPALKFLLLQTLFDWLKASNLITSDSVSDMLMLCSFWFCYLCTLFTYTSYLHGVRFILINEILTCPKKKRIWTQYLIQLYEKN